MTLSWLVHLNGKHLNLQSVIQQKVD